MGITTAFLKTFGKVPVDKHRLNTWARAGPIGMAMDFRIFGDRLSGEAEELAKFWMMDMMDGTSVGFNTKLFWFGGWF